MRFLQCSDIHLNIIPESGLPFSKDRENDIKTSFRKILEKAKELHVDCVFIPGNLFHHTPLSQDLQEVDALFSTLTNTQIIILSGAEDKISDNSPLLSYRWKSPVFWLSQGEEVYFDKLNTLVTGISCSASELKAEYEKYKEKGSLGTGHSPIRILLFFDTEGNVKPIDPLDYQDLPFDYIALGGRTTPMPFKGERLVASGSPEPLSERDGGEHGIYVGDISAISRKLSNLEFIPISKVHYITLEYTIRKDTDIERLKNALIKKIKELGKQNIYSIRINGISREDIYTELASISRMYRISNIYNNTAHGHDIEALYKEHTTDLVGYYIRDFVEGKGSKDMLSEVESLALDYGLTALLNELSEEEK